MLRVSKVLFSQFNEKYYSTVILQGHRTPIAVRLDLTITTQRHGLTAAVQHTFLTFIKINYKKC